MCILLSAGGVGGDRGALFDFVIFVARINCEKFLFSTIFFAIMDCCVTCPGIYRCCFQPAGVGWLSVISLLHKLEI